MDKCPNCEIEMIEPLPGAICKSDGQWCPDCKILIDGHHTYRRIQSICDSHTIMWNNIKNYTLVYQINVRTTPSYADFYRSTPSHYFNIKLPYKIDTLEKLEKYAILI